MLHQPSRLLSVSSKMRAKQGKEQSEFLCSWHPWQECAGWTLGTQDGLTLLVETSLRWYLGWNETIIDEDKQEEGTVFTKALRHERQWDVLGTMQCLA